MTCLTPYLVPQNNEGRFLQWTALKYFLENQETPIEICPPAPLTCDFEIPPEDETYALPFKPCDTINWIMNADELQIDGGSTSANLQIALVQNGVLVAANIGTVTDKGDGQYFCSATIPAMPQSLGINVVPNPNFLFTDANDNSGPPINGSQPNEGFVGWYYTEYALLNTVNTTALSGGYVRLDLGGGTRTGNVLTFGVKYKLTFDLTFNSSSFSPITVNQSDNTIILTYNTVGNTTTSVEFTAVGDHIYFASNASTNGINNVYIQPVISEPSCLAESCDYQLAVYDASISQPINCGGYAGSTLQDIINDAIPLSLVLNCTLNDFL